MPDLRIALATTPPAGVVATARAARGAAADLLVVDAPPEALGSRVRVRALAAELEGAGAGGLPVLVRFVDRDSDAAPVDGAPRCVGVLLDGRVAARQAPLAASDDVVVVRVDGADLAIAAPEDLDGAADRLRAAGAGAVLVVGVPEAEPARAIGLPVVGTLPDDALRLVDLTLRTASTSLPAGVALLLPPAG